jgi:hypothetical protein
MEDDEILCDKCGHKKSCHVEENWEPRCNQCDAAPAKNHSFSMPWCERCEMDGHKKGELCIDELARRVRNLEKWRHG